MGQHRPPDISQVANMMPPWGVGTPTIPCWEKDSGFEVNAPCLRMPFACLWQFCGARQENGCNLLIKTNRHSLFALLPAPTALRFSCTRFSAHVVLNLRLWSGASPCLDVFRRVIFAGSKSPARRNQKPQTAVFDALVSYCTFHIWNKIYHWFSCLILDGLQFGSDFGVGPAKVFGVGKALRPLRHAAAAWEKQM